MKLIKKTIKSWQNIIIYSKLVSRKIHTNSSEQYTLNRNMKVIDHENSTLIGVSWTIDGQHLWLLTISSHPYEIVYIFVDLVSWTLAVSLAMIL